MQRNEIDEKVIRGLKTREGILDVRPFQGEDREKLIQIENEAQESSMMGLGNVINTGVNAVLDRLDRGRVYVALTGMEFAWGDYPSLIMKKGEEIVGEEILDKEKVGRLKAERDIWVMGGCFVVYKDKVVFPHDIVKKVCLLETPPIPVDWCPVADERVSCSDIILANPAMPSDLFLKDRYFGGLDVHGTGTILIGVRLTGEAEPS